MAKASLDYVGPYRLLNVVNTGQTSQVWQAYHDGLHQIFGVKTLLQKFAKDRQHLNFLRHEHTVGRDVSHDRVIDITAFEVDRGTPYLVMEWFPAQNMKRWILQGGKDSAYLVPQIIEQSAEGLSHLNQQGWVHRDVKPDNFLINNEGQVKLIDLALAVRAKKGLAKLLGGKGKVQGTRSYMSPEQIRGGPLDQRADVYSFGCTMHELLSGKPPFTGISANELLSKHLKSPPPILSAADRNVTPEFSQLVRDCLAKKPDERPESIEDFLRQFRSLRVYRRMPAPPTEAARSDSPDLD